jgi:hypothetical protein
MRWAGKVVRTGERRGAYRALLGKLERKRPLGAYRVLLGKPERKRPLGRPRRRWGDIIELELQ